MPYPNSLSHLTQKECDKITDILFDFRNGLADLHEEIVQDPNTSRADIDMSNEELREMDRLLDRLTPGAKCDSLPQESEDNYDDDSASLRDHFHFGS
jgi:hypothetical protein